MIERKFYNYTVLETGDIVSATGRVLKQSTNSAGYKCVCLYYNKASHITNVHRLVAMLFIPLPYGLEYKDCHVEHIDGDRGNNHYKNLKWVDTHGMGCTRFRLRAAPVEVTYPDGTKKTYPSMHKAAEGERLCIITVSKHANYNTTDSRGRTWKRL